MTTQNAEALRQMKIARMQQLRKDYRELIKGSKDPHEKTAIAAQMMVLQMRQEKLAEK